MIYLPLHNNSDSTIDDNKKKNSNSDVDNKKKKDSKSNVDNFKKEKSNDNNSSITLPYWGSLPLARGGLPLAKGWSFYNRTLLSEEKTHLTLLSIANIVTRFFHSYAQHVCYAPLNLQLSSSNITHIRNQLHTKTNQNGLKM